MKDKFGYTIPVILCLLVSGLMAACQSRDNNPTSTVDNSPQGLVEATKAPTQPAIPTVTSTPNADEIRMAIVNALLALYTRQNRMDVTTMLDDGKTSTSTIEFVPPDRKRIVSLEGNMEYIVIGEKVYANSSGEWQETQIPASTFLGDGAVTAQTIGEIIGQGQFLRQDQFEGADVLIYSYASTTRSGDIKLHSQTELWVSVEDGLPMKMIVDGEILSASTDPATGESKLQPVNALTTTIIVFDPTIRIEPPAVPTPVSLNFEEWVRTLQPDQALIQSVELPYLRLNY